MYFYKETSFVITNFFFVMWRLHDGRNHNSEGHIYQNLWLFLILISQRPSENVKPLQEYLLTRLIYCTKTIIL